MALPLPQLTFYRMPDVYLSGTTMVDMLTAISGSLTSLVDYRGTTLADTHKWTWATASTGGTFTTIYNTAVPASSSMTQNPTIIFAGSSGSFTPTMNSLTADTYAANTLLVGINKNGTVHTTWTGSLPMTTGSFTGYLRADISTANATTTYIRSYVSQETIFLCVIAGSTTQYWTYAGSMIEPYTSYANSIAVTASCETDDRLYGVTAQGAVIPSSILNTNGGWLYTRGVIFVPTTTTNILIQRRTTHLSTGVNMQLDNDGNYVLERVRMFRVSSTPNYTMGTYYGFYMQPYIRQNEHTVRQEGVDKYHFVCYSDAGAGQGFALKAVS